MAVLAAGALLIDALWIRSLAALIDLATVLSFITAPFLGVLSLRAVTAEWMPEHLRPSTPLRTLAVVGIGFLATFLVVFLVSRFLSV
jgi:hypothetical protein